MAGNPVMFVVEIGSFLTSILFIRDIFFPDHAATPLWFTGLVSVWLWFTVIFANFAGRGRGERQGAGRGPEEDEKGHNSVSLPGRQGMGNTLIAA